jgi:hypothetical protein
MVALKIHSLTVRSTVRGKAIPLQVWIGSEDSRRLRLPDFKKISI